ncbi:hypothetical protein [Streptomyces sp. NPDC059994]|uniref:hypothetical protein n=1 Tax=Streptomyces sp. NPDC059994 TaxID=3347029 RepID=UPI0036A44A20
MKTATITAADIVKRYADGIAYVAEKTPATDLDSFIDHLDTAVRYFGMVGINGHEDLETAGILLGEALHADDDTERAVFLRKADKLLKPVPDILDEYRDMVGD